MGNQKRVLGNIIYLQKMTWWLKKNRPSFWPLFPIQTNSFNYTRGQVSVNKRNSVLSNYFDVSFEIYYVRLKYIDSIGQVVKLLILRPASIYCTFKPGHIGSLERWVLQMSTKWGALFISIHPGYG